MDENLKKTLKKACVEPLEHVYDILSAGDSNLNKVIAAKIYCKRTLKAIKKTIQEELNDVA